MTKKKVWQTPGTSEAAEWLALTTDSMWEVTGGTWYRPSTLGGHVFIVMTPGDSEEPALGHARWFNVESLTLPERKRWGLAGLPLTQRCIQSGYGYIFSSVNGPKMVTIRNQVLSAVKDFEARGGDKDCMMPAAPRVHHRRWEALRVSDPVTYAEGFFLGMQRVDIDPENETIAAGWEHGWEYTMGRAPLPRWYNSTQGKREANE